MPQIIFVYSLDCLRTFPEMFNDIPRNVWGHSPECLVRFPGIFEDIPRNIGNIPWNVSGHSPECFTTFPGMFGDIPRNVWRHSLEYNFPPNPRVPRIPFNVPVFLVLYIAHSDWIRRDAPHLSAFSRNAGKYGPEKLRIRTLFTQCLQSSYTKNLGNFPGKHLTWSLVFRI